MDTQLTLSHPGENWVQPAAPRVGTVGMVHAYRRRLPLFFAVLGSFVLLAAAVTWLQTPRYTATASLMIAPKKVSVGSDSSGAPVTDAYADANVDSQVEVLKSGALAQAVVDRLDLVHDRAFAASLHPRSRLPWAKARPAPAVSRADAVEAIGKGLTVRRVAQTLVLEVGFSSPDAREAARIADAYADAYVAQSVGLKLDDSRSANTLLGAQLDRLRGQVEGAETAVARYKAQHNLLSVQGSTMAEQEIAALDQQVAANRASAAEAAARLNTANRQTAQGSHGDDVGEALNSPVVQELRKQRAAATQKLADLQVRFGPRYPDVVSAQDQVADIDRQIAAEIKRVISNLDAQNRVAKERVGSLEGSLGQARGSLSSGNAASVGLNELQRTADAARALYEGVLNRVKETQTQAATALPDARVVNPAVTPDHPTSPKPLVNMILGLLLGTGAGIAAVVLRQEFDTGLSTMEDVEERLRLPYFGALPTLDSALPGRFGGASRSPPDQLTQNASSSFTESFRGLAATLRRRGRRSPQVVALTSALPKEGKTIAAVCLSRMMALMHLKVVLVDCDLRRPSVADTLRLSPRAGLLDVLEGRARLEDAIATDDATPLHVLTIGRAEALGESPFALPSMDALLNDLRARYDVVVLDTCPVLPVAEGRIVCEKADSVVMLVRWRKTPEKAARMAARILDSLGVNVEGVALTRMDQKAQARSGYGDPGFYYSQFKAYYAP